MYLEARDVLGALGLVYADPQPPWAIKFWSDGRRAWAGVGETEEKYIARVEDANRRIAAYAASQSPVQIPFLSSSSGRIALIAGGGALVLGVVAWLLLRK